jgi:phospholipase C
VELVGRGDAPGGQGEEGRPVPRLSRRQLLGAASLGAAGVALGRLGRPSSGRAPSARPRLTAASGTAVRQPGTLPNPAVPAGTDQVPEIEHIVVVMMENHSFDNMLGMLGRGDGFSLGPDGRPTAALPDGRGGLVHAFPMPTPCQNDGVSNSWNTGHRSYDGGTNRGFVGASSGETMGYFDGQDLPFLWGLARTFPLADRWFCSVLAQTYPNRRYLVSGTSLGLVSDTYPTELPPNGTIFDSFNRYGISWRDYYSDAPTTIGVYLPLLSQPAYQDNLAKMSQFFSDAAAGTLPQFSMVEPNYTVSSEEDPQDVQYGDQFLAAVVDAVLRGPQWSKTLLIWNYDEWGGWYDHVPPPAAVPPDDVAPDLPPGSVPGAFDRYGFRVPAGVVSPYARPDHVSHVVFDHTSILKTVERKWNLPALTRRDANANDVLSMLDLKAEPAFLTPPALPDPANPVESYRCLFTGPGQLPPASAVTRS